MASELERRTLERDIAEGHLRQMAGRITAERNRYRPGSVLWQSLNDLLGSSSLLGKADSPEEIARGVVEKLVTTAPPESLTATVYGAHLIEEAMSAALATERALWKGIADNAIRASWKTHRRLEEMQRTLARVPPGEVASLQSDNSRCRGCAGPHAFDTSVPSPAWNEVVRSLALPEYLCVACITRLFCRAGRPLVAQLWGDDVSGAILEVVPVGKEAPVVPHTDCFAAQERLLGQRAEQEHRADVAEARLRELLAHTMDMVEPGDGQCRVCNESIGEHKECPAVALATPGGPDGK